MRQAVPYRPSHRTAELGALLQRFLSRDGESRAQEGKGRFECRFVSAAGLPGKGEEKSAWIVDYTDAKGVRRQKTFAKKKEADAFEANATVEIRDGVHVADSDSLRAGLPRLRSALIPEIATSQ